LRGLGYSAGSAAADLVDNSIAAGARQVRADFEWAESPRIVFKDDGRGMNRDELIAAMRLGSDPRAERNLGDLGRFGLGLKTASFSQANSLAVVSNAEGQQACAARWSLDRIDTASDWEIEVGSPEELGLGTDLPIGLTGTTVIWENLDILLGRNATIDKLYGTAEIVARHLGMTFHRFIESDRTQIYVNDVEVAPWDPLVLQLAEQVFSEELEPAGIALHGSILPSPDKLDEDEARRLAGPNEFLEQQGFYVYRQDRLIVGGGWLGIGRSTQSWRLDKKYNLARLSIDLGNGQDEAWSIDVKKSTAVPPPELRAELYRFASRVRRKAASRVELATTGSGAAEAASAPIPIWVLHSDGGANFRLNRRHPLVGRLRQGGADSGALRSLLDAIERTAPRHGASLGPRPVDAVAAARQMQIESDLSRLVRTVYLNARKAAGLSPEDARARLMDHPAMRQHEEKVAMLVETIEKELRIDL
jgi:hypothetical protein